MFKAYHEPSGRMNKNNLEKASQEIQEKPALLPCSVILEQMAPCSLSSAFAETWPETKLSPTAFPSTYVSLNVSAEPVF